MQKVFVALQPRVRDRRLDTCGRRGLCLPRNLWPMDGTEVRTVADVEQLSPDERQRLVNERTSTDLSEIPDDFVARARADGRRLLVERGVIDDDR